MLRLLFPPQFDNVFRGHWAAIWILVPVVLLKLLMGLNVAGLNPFVDNEFVLRAADHIPIDTYSQEARRAVTFLFACWGLALLTLSAFAGLALTRYRSMVPLACLLLFIEQGGRRLLSLTHPVVRSVEAGAMSSGELINWALTVALGLGLLLSVMPARAERPA